MELKEFVENFDSQTKIKIVENDEVLFEGNADVLEKLLRAKVKKQGCSKEDDVMVVKVAQYV